MPGDEVERVMYGYSVLFCLPNSLAEAGVGRDRDRAAAGPDAGAGGGGRLLERVTIVPIEHDMFRFYRLDP